MRALKGVFGICLAFQIFGFAYVAYPSAQKAYGFYGDFHGGPPDSRYVDALAGPWSAIPPLGLFFVEGKITKAAIDMAHPAAAGTDGRENATRAVITVGILNRTLALILLYCMTRTMRVRPYAAAVALTVFSFQYTNIALTQSMKFVAGLPVFMAWAWSLNEYETRPAKKWLVIHCCAAAGALVTEQWIIFAILATYLVRPAVKRVCNLPITGFDVAGTAGVVLVSAGLYATEAARIASGRLPLLPIVPSLARSLYLYEYPVLALLAIAACAAGVFFARQKSVILKRKEAVALGIVPVALFARALTFVHPAIFTDTHFMTFFFPYWTLVSLAIFMVIMHAVAEERPDALTVLAITLWLASALPQLLLVIGVSIPTSPVLDAVVTPVLVLAAGARKNAAFPALALLVAAVAALSLHKWLDYTNGWHMLGL